MKDPVVKYKNDYNRANYSHWNLYMTPGLKEIVIEQANVKNMTLTSYVKMAVEQQLLKDGIPAETLQCLEQEAKKKKEDRNKKQQS